MRTPGDRRRLAEEVLKFYEINQSDGAFDGDEKSAQTLWTDQNDCNQSGLPVPNQLVV
jgi:hypothetical protein